MSKATVEPYDTDAPTPAAAGGVSVSGLALALASAAAFGTSGVFGKALIASGWSPGAVVLARIAVAAVVMLGPALWLMRGHWTAARRHGRVVLLYGVLAVAGAQLAFFTAVSYLSVGVALLIEYLAPVLLVGLAWAQSRRPPSRATALGVALALGGLVLVIDAFGGDGAQVNVPGVLWAVAAAVGLATYFAISARPLDGLPPVALAAGGLVVGAATLGLAGLLGVLEMVTATADISLAGRSLPWWVGIAEVSLVAAAFAYVAGIEGARRLGVTLASFVGLTEVLFAVGFAWVLLDEQPTVTQAVGGLLIIGGVVAVRLGADFRGAAAVA